MNKKTSVLFVALALMFGAAMGAVAASNNETISALLNRDITVIYNGTKQTFTDAAGTVVYPISYNGSTYLPVRAVSNLVGLPIQWDGATDTITLGTTEKQPTALTGLKNSGGTEYSWVINDKAELTVAGSDANQTYSSGVQWKIWNSTSSVAHYRLVSFDVAGYTQVSFSAWSDVDCTVQMMDQDEKVVSSFDMTAGSIVSKTVNLPAGVTTIGFGANALKYAPDNHVLKILDPVVK